MTQNFLKVPTFTDNQDEQNRLTANAINGILDGKINSIGSITLTNSSTTTTLSDARIGGNSLILLMPISSDSASENWYITGIGKQTATINHSSDTTTRTFKYVIIG
jgi:hypothetical protein